MGHPSRTYRERTYYCAEMHRTRSWQWNDVTHLHCTQCGEMATEAGYAIVRNAQGFKPPIVAHNPATGEYRHIASERSRIPKGFERVELRTAPEISRALRAMDARDREAHERQQEREERGRAGYSDPYRDYRPQTAFGEQLERYAREQHDYGKRFDSRNYIAAFEYNPGNLHDE